MGLNKIIDGKQIALQIQERIKLFLQEKGYRPHLAVIIVGDDGASQIYVKTKERTCANLGISSTKVSLPKETTQEDLIIKINELNKDNTINGILLQLPLPKHIDTNTVLQAIAPNKDVDGFHPINKGYLMQGDIEKAFIPCTPNGCLNLIKSAIGNNLAGKKALVIGRSQIVGLPMAQLLIHESATVSVANSHSDNLAELCLNSDIIVAAVGRAKMIQQSWIKDNAVVIDVGINRVDDASAKSGYILYGDVEQTLDLMSRAYVSPVPGGVGPMTIAFLMVNTLKAYLMQHDLYDNSDINNILGN